MTTNQRKVASIAALLERLGSYCDSGFAIAIHIRYTRPTLLYRTYGPEWIEHYSEMGFMLSDPVVRWGLMNVGSVDWSSLVDQDPEGVMAAAKAHGLLNGWTYSVGPATSRTISGLTRSTGPYTPEEQAELRQIVDAIHEETEGFERMTPGTQEALRALGSG